MSGGNLYRQYRRHNGLYIVYEMLGGMVRVRHGELELYTLPGGQVRVRHGEYGLYELPGKLLFVGRCGVLYRMRH